MKETMNRAPRGCGADVPTLRAWLSWPTRRIAAWIRARGRPLVMGWPPNGTRRYHLAHRRRTGSDGDYFAVSGGRTAELQRMAFAHGVDVLVAPCFGAELEERGSAYVERALGGLLRLADEPAYRAMFAAGVRLRFYGDYEERLGVPGRRHLLDACRALVERTGGLGAQRGSPARSPQASTGGSAAPGARPGPLLLIGLWADAPWAAIARISVDFARRTGRPPGREELIEAYYGAPVPDLGLFIFSDRPALFDVPLITTGREDLYATLGPSLDMTEQQFREILYDHLVARAASDIDDYGRLPAAGMDALLAELEGMRGATLGVGRVDPATGRWKLVLPDLPREGAR